MSSICIEVCEVAHVLCEYLEYLSAHYKEKVDHLDTASDPMQYTYEKGRRKQLSVEESCRDGATFYFLGCFWHAKR